MPLFLFNETQRFPWLARAACQVLPGVIGSLTRADLPTGRPQVPSDQFLQVTIGAAQRGRVKISGFHRDDQLTMTRPATEYL